MMDRIAYKPLGTSPPEDQDGRPYEEDQPFYLISDNHDFFCYKFPLCNYFCPSFGLRQLRTIMYLVAAILILLFITELSTIDKSSKGSRLDSPIVIAQKLSMSKGDRSLQIVESSPSIREVRLLPNDNYLSSLTLNQEDPDLSAGQLMDDLDFPDEEIDPRSLEAARENSNAEHKWWTTKRSQDEAYVIVTNYIRSTRLFGHNSSITLTTLASFEFMYHALELCKRWDGPISVSVFCPGEELEMSVTLIKFMRQCLPPPLSNCIKEKISWHLLYNADLGPDPDTLGYPRQRLDRKHYSTFVDQGQCPKFALSDPESLIVQFQKELAKHSQHYPESIRKSQKLTFPINLARNVARQAASTWYVLASDIELYPSVNLVPSFMNFISRGHLEREFSFAKRIIFTLPIFEVDPRAEPPKTKEELVKLFKKNLVIYFHKHVCDYCQIFPHRSEWMSTDKYGLDNYHANEDEIVIFDHSQRDRSRSSWEPIFIGTNEDPLYDEQLTWDGRRDKMSQMYEMCLLDYHLLILGNAFLVHAPGIKHLDRGEMAKRIPFIRKNNQRYEATIAKLKQQYSNSGKIDKC